MPVLRKYLTLGWSRNGCAMRLKNAALARLAASTLVLREDVQRGQRGAAGQRIAGVGMRMQEAARGLVGIEGLVDIVRRHHDGERQVAAGDAFGQQQEVRGNTGCRSG